MPDNQTTQTTETAQTTQPTDGQQQTQTPPASFDEWIKGQPAEVAALIDSHVTGLRNTVQATRRERDDLAKQLRDAAKGLEQGSEARKALEAMTAQVEAAEVRAAFYEDAAKPEIGCTNARLAYIAAQQDALIDNRGRVNWESLRQTYPELFRRAAPTSNAGAGTQNTQPATGGMNEFIRRAAGRT